MSSRNSAAKARLFKLLDKIIGEEQGFRASSKGTRGRSIFSRHGLLVQVADRLQQTSQYRKAKEELHRVHRQFTSEHELLIQRCHARARQVRAGLLTETEMALELERLQSDYRRLKTEHRRAEEEGRKLLQSLGLQHAGPRQIR